MTGLTARQLALLDFIRAFQTKHRIAPSHEEMRLAMGYASRSTVNRMCDALVARGAIRRDVRKARAIEIVPAEQVGVVSHLVRAVSPAPVNPSSLPAISLRDMDSRALMGLRSDIDCELKRRREGL